MMRRLLLCLLSIVPLPLWAAPFIVADLADATTTHCARLLDTAAQGPDVAVVGTTAKQCRIDVSDVAVGAHTVRLVAIKVDAVWGRQESAPSVPFSFTRPAPPPAPSSPTLTP